MFARKLYFFFFIICMSFFSGLNAQFISGKITNEQNESIPYATIYLSETKKGTISNQDGHFHFALSKGKYHLTIRSLGYVQVEREIELDSDTLLLNIEMQRQDFEIKEVLVFPGKEDPAYFIIRKAMAHASYFRERIKHYEAELYIKSNFTFTNIPKFYQNRMEVNGKKLKDAFTEGITYLMESQNKITFDYPDNYKQDVIAKKSSLTGFEEPPVMGLLTSNFYKERPNNVISPLSSQALNHYTYRYEGFITSGDFDIFKIKVSPKRKSKELVSGYIYIVDRLWCIYNADFTAQIDFFEYHINQQYQNLGNDNWMPVSHLINGQFSILGLKGKFYYGASLEYQNIEENNRLISETVSEEKEKADEIENEKEIALRKEVAQIIEKEELSNRDVKTVARLNRKILKEQYKDSTLAVSQSNNYNIEDLKDSVRTNSFVWDTVRAIPLTPDEFYSYRISDSLKIVEKQEAGQDSAGSKKNKKSLLKKIISGETDFCKDSLVKLGYGGLISAQNADFNAVDGYKYKQSFNLTLISDSGKQVNFSPEIGYAFNRKAVFWKVESRLVNILTENSRLSIDFGKESRDFKPSPTGISPMLNSISSWWFGRNYMRLYETSFFSVNLRQKLGRHINIYPMFEFNNFAPLENHARYKLSDKREYAPNIPKGIEENSAELAPQKSTVMGLAAIYRVYQQKPWLEKSNFLFINDFYSIQLSYKQGINNVLGSVSDFSQIDLRFQQQANLSPTAGLDWSVNAGSFLHSNQIHFSQYKHFPTSDIPVSFSSFTHTFQLINDYMYSTNQSYLKAGAEYRCEYLLLRYLSFLNRRTWSESIHLNYLTTPALKNYWEAGYSANNLFFIGNVGFFAGFEGGRFKHLGFKISVTDF